MLIHPYSMYTLWLIDWTKHECTTSSIDNVYTISVSHTFLTFLGQHMIDSLFAAWAPVKFHVQTLIDSLYHNMIACSIPNISCTHFDWQLVYKMSACNIPCTYFDRQHVYNISACNIFRHIDWYTLFTTCVPGSFLRFHAHTLIDRIYTTCAPITFHVHTLIDSLLMTWVLVTFLTFHVQTLIDSLL